MEVRNKFKGLDLIDRVPDEPWMEVPDIVQETGSQGKNTEVVCHSLLQWTTFCQTPSSNNTREDSTNGYHQMVNT